METQYSINQIILEYLMRTTEKYGFKLNITDGIHNLPIIGNENILYDFNFIIIYDNLEYSMSIHYDRKTLFTKTKIKLLSKEIDLSEKINSINEIHILL